jgi:two-component system, cell cycle response regulator
MTNSILELICQADSLPSLPAVAVQVLQLTRSDDVSVAEIARVIENDPALTSKILKVANSSLFGMPRQICSLQQAMVVLGLRTIKVMALTFSLVEALQSEPGGFDHPEYWRRSLTAAVAARLLTQHVPSCQADELFVAALLSDIGILAAYHVDRQTYRQVLADCAAAGVPIHLIEQRHYGMTHEKFSSQLLDTWGLPENMVQAVAHHHAEPDRLLDLCKQRGSDLPRLLGAAMLIADMFCSPTGASQLSLVKTHVPRLVPVSDDCLNAMLDEIHKQVQETASTWDIDIGATRSYKDVQAEAVVQLAKLTMSAELERAQLAAREQELHTQNADLARKAATDGLTGVANRIALEEHLDALCKSALRQPTAVGVMILDLDRFKRLNDSFGHQVGDAALRLVGEYLRTLADDRRFVARYGGEEFVIVIAKASANEMRKSAEEVRLRIQQIRIPCKERQIAVTVSIGATLSTTPTPEMTPASLISRADKYLYQAKESGRNRVVFIEDKPTAARSATSPALCAANG